MFCERYLATGHHIEVQVMADEHGTVWAVGERECSIQRRHQKVIEEAPSPLVERTPGMRDKLFDAARLAASAIGYTGAGTVEFMADESGDFFFLEMNTRLQVEHPVTEATTGLDLVALQLQVADGGRLDPEPPPSRGLLDRGPAVRRGSRPRTGSRRPARCTASKCPTPQHDSACSTVSGVRVDTGIEDGSEVSVFYDPMLAKVISYAPTRRQAAGLLADALARTRMHGVRTNRDLLVNVLRHPAFLDGATDTAFFDTHGLAELAAPLADARAVELSALAAALADAAENRAGGNGIRRRTQRLAQRHVGLPDQELPRQCGRDARGPLPLHPRRAGSAGLRRGEPGVGVARLRWCWPSTAWTGRSTSRGTATTCSSTRTLGPVQLVALPRFPDPTAALAHGSLLAPMPGSVLRIGAAVGDTVTAGQPLIWMEAMKMEHTVVAPGDGVLVELNVEPGQQVEVGAVLARVEDQPKEPAK